MASEGSAKDTKAVAATGTSGTPGRASASVAKARAVIAQVIWLLFVVAALFLAVGALLVALDANEDNNLVQFVLDGADAVDLGVFSIDNGIMKFTGENAETKNALFNWGIGAVVWLVVGRILDRLVRP
ncbi:MAG: hypothetical protein JHC95_14025 [Solirubrobacteraceae bacterium]|nr:hypothetical protein [Solirubrobacteraceae bacterium]